MRFKYPVYRDGRFLYTLSRSVQGWYAVIMIPRDQGLAGQGQTVNLLRIKTLEMALRYLDVYAQMMRLRKVFEPEGGKGLEKT